jgi:predicted DNA-binding transcriptional regulator AlpA
METTDIPDIKVADVVHLAGVSRSTFYRHYDGPSRTW